jgi:hypothetical protein
MPIFDLASAVQQGLNRDPVNNDWSVNARNLEIDLEDAAGSSEFRVNDVNDVSVIVGRSDGYLAVHGTLEAHGGNLLVQHQTSLNPELITLQDTTDQAGIFLLNSDPNGSVTAQQGSMGLNYADGYLYVNRDGASEWARIPVVAEVGGGSTITLQQAYDNDSDGANATITTNATDGSVEIAGDQSLLVNATGGLDLNTLLDFDGTTFDVVASGAVSIDSSSASNVTVTGANLTLSTLTSGNVVVSSAGDVDVDGANLLLDATAAISLDAAAASNFTVAGANLTLSTTTSGDVIANSAGDVDVDGANVLVDATAGVSLDAAAASNFTVTGADLTLSTATSGDVFVRSAGDVVIDEGAGTEYLRANNALNELQLGDVTGTVVNVKVLSDLAVDGDLIVSGTTTTVNTTETFVRDRMLRLNVGAVAGFNGTTGFEAEVGSDGYVELHWDDAQTRWELSIDRNTTPEAQTFRPIPYLADAPGTLDLSATGTDGYTPPNTTSGASVVNTNSSNFVNTFGPAMTSDSVQAALEAIDGYLTNVVTPALSTASTTLQQAYDNDVDGGNATITTNATDGNVEIAGDQALQVTATGGLDVDTLVDFDGTTFDVVASGAVSLDSSAASNFTVASNSLTLATTTSGNVIVSSAGDVDVDGANLLLDATAAISLDAASASNFTVAGANLTLSTTTSGNVIANSAGDVDVDGVNVLIDASTAVSIDSASASNFTVAGANLTLSTTTSGSVIVDGAGGVTLDGNGSHVAPAATNLDSLGTSALAWLDGYFRNVDNTADVGLHAVGAAAAPNITSGAAIIGTNNTNFATFGGSMTSTHVQAALEAIDGYLGSLGASFIQTRILDINGAVINGNVGVSFVGTSPTLGFESGKTGRASWSIALPGDWDGLSDFIVEVLWSPSSTNAGDVEWRLESNALALTELASSAATNDDFTQTAGGTTDAIQTTGGNLSVLASAITQATDELIIVNIVRRGTAAGDTFTGDAQVHAVKYSYTALKS